MNNDPRKSLSYFILIFILFFELSMLAQKPADIMENCNQWKITYPTGSEDKTLCNEANNEYFYLNDAGNAIVFRAPIRNNNGTTPNSSYIRSELRERVADGSSDIYWTTAGRHMIYVKQAITHLPINKPHLVATQIHGNKADGIDDSMVMRLENSHLFLSFNGGKLRDNLTIKTNYTLGDIHEVIFLIEDGKHYCYYSEDGNLLNAYNNGTASSYLVKDGANDYVMDLNYDKTYFKVGNYTQSNAEKEGTDTDNANNYGEVLVYDFSVTHDKADVTGISLSPSTVNLTQGSSYQLSETVLPSNASNKKVSFSSSNTSVAEVNSDGIVSAISVGKTTITVTTEENGFTDTSEITVLENSDGPNLALNKNVSATGTHDADNSIENLVDGLTSTRWSVSGFPQTATIDLGEEYLVNRTELVCYNDRAYQYTISVSTTEDGNYTQIVDRSENSTQGTDENPIINVFTEIPTRFVKITVTDADVYTGSWVSLLEFRIFGTNALNLNNNLTPVNSVKLWPIPANNFINVSGAEAFETLKIYDQIGKLIINKSLKQETIDISNLKSGLYIFSFSNNKQTINKQVLKK